MAAWSDGRDNVKAQIFDVDANGATRFGSEALLNTQTAGEQTSPVI